MIRDVRDITAPHSKEVNPIHNYVNYRFDYETVIIVLQVQFRMPGGTLTSGYG